MKSLNEDADFLVTDNVSYPFDEETGRTLVVVDEFHGVSSVAGNL